jgi:uncharacterized protein YdaT
MLPFSHPSQRSKYRSARSVRPSNGGNSGSLPVKWTKSRATFFFLAVLAVAGVTVIPILILEGTYPDKLQNINHHQPQKMLQISNAVVKEAVHHSVHVDLTDKNKNNHNKDSVKDQEEELEIEREENQEPDLDNSADQEDNENQNIAEDGDEEPSSPLVRGVNQFPLSRTPALIGASRGHVQCDVPIDEERIVYWSSPQGDRDRAFESPFKPPQSDQDYYLSFQPDRGGWNNIRMSMEVLFVMAAATGRTLVLPPKVPLYLLGHGKEGARSFGDFFPLHNPELLKKVKIISMKEFIEKEAPKWTDLSEEQQTKLKEVSELCLHREGDELDCEILNSQLRARGYQPQIKPETHCYIFDEKVLETGDPNQLSDDAHLEVEKFCGGDRQPVFYDKTIMNSPFIHWDAGCDSMGQKDTEHCFRLLQHFYTFIHFTDVKIDNYYKRFVRDFLHYNDDVYCAAGKVVAAVQKDADALNVEWSAWHVRRGDLQYKKVKISAEEWYENTKEVWQPGELLYIATDERNKAFFDPVKAKGHPIKFLDDYWDIGGLGDLDKTYIGMVDTIVASHGRAFAGTWFSTFSGYINRLRGYLGKSMKNSWYSYLPRKTSMRDFMRPQGNLPAREWQVGWLGIDTDEHIMAEQNVEADIHDVLALKSQRKSDGKPIKFKVRRRNVSITLCRSQFCV